MSGVILVLLERVCLDLLSGTDRLITYIERLPPVVNLHISQWFLGVLRGRVRAIYHLTLYLIDEVPWSYRRTIWITARPIHPRKVGNHSRGPLFICLNIPG